MIIEFVMELVQVRLFMFVNVCIQKRLEHTVPIGATEDGKGAGAII